LKKRYFLHLAYNGYKFHGWQTQLEVRSVQEVLEKQLSKILKRETKVHGCGRTDAQVHASQYFLHFLTEESIDFDLIFRLNKTLPDAISVYDLIPFEIRANAQRDAVKRTYDYFLHGDKNPYLSEFSSLQSMQNLDLKLMGEAVTFLKTVQDFRSLCISVEQYKTTICEIFDLALYTNPKNNRLRISITANRFLRKMIRIIVASILDIGNGKIKLEQFKLDVINGNRPSITKPAHPQGLFLSKVTYPFLDIEPRFNPILDNEQWEIIS
jgi:tRNA pseudouridine38-40 synthase